MRAYKKTLLLALPILFFSCKGKGNLNIISTHSETDLGIDVYNDNDQYLGTLSTEKTPYYEGCESYTASDLISLELEEGMYIFHFTTETDDITKSVEIKKNECIKLRLF